MTVMLGLVGGAGVAQADDLTDARSRVRRAIVSTKQEIAEAKAAVESATARLERSQAALAKARSELNYINGKLESARAQDQKLAAALAESQRLSAAAKKAVDQGELDVAAQETLIGVAVRTAYQQQSSLVGLGVALASETPGDLARRLQWSNTIFDTSAAELERLEDLQAHLVAAKQARAEAEKLVAEQRRISANHLAATQALAADAAARRSRVAGLVVQNEKDKESAEADLVADEKDYRTLQAQDQSIQAQIKARIEAQKKAEAAARAKAKALAAAKAKAAAAAAAAAKAKNTAANKAKAAAAAKAAAVAKAAVDSTPTTAASSKGFIYPVNAKAGSPFGMRYHPILHYWRMHSGTDFGARCGAPLYAVADGKVASARWQGGFGNYVVIDHGRIGGQYLSSGYAHQSKMAVRAGQRVSQGQVIGYVGTTGLSTGCHLHFQIYQNGTPVNPMKFL